MAKHQGMAEKGFRDYLGPERSRNLTILPFGCECELAIQCVPDIVREGAEKNIAVSQVVRYAKPKDGESRDGRIVPRAVSGLSWQDLDSADS